MLICTNCTLPETFSGIHFDENGVCNYCVHFNEKQLSQNDIKKRYKQKFLDIINKQISESSNRIARSYDVIIAYSGGKDSTYTLKILKEIFDLRIIAITFNHGFISQQALKNIEKMTGSLSVDHIMITPAPKVIYHAFKESLNSNSYPMKALERASSLCNTCMNLAKSLLLKHAIEMDIPFIAYGWSPGQAPIQSSVMMLNPSMIRQTQSAMIKILSTIMNDDLNAFILHDRHYNMLENDSAKKALYNIHPLAFMDYNEQAILDEILKIGWEPPKDTDSNSTNCLLNSYANVVHQEQFGFHPYAFEVAYLVRAGHMRRDEGMAKLSAPPDKHIINIVKDKLNKGI